MRPTWAHLSLGYIVPLFIPWYVIKSNFILTKHLLTIGLTLKKTHSQDSLNFRTLNQWLGYPSWRCFFFNLPTLCPWGGLSICFPFISKFKFKWASRAGHAACSCVNISSIYKVGLICNSLQKRAVMAVRDWLPFRLVVVLAYGLDKYAVTSENAIDELK